MTWLYIKKHKVTGLKYFGKTIQKDPYKYQGSGRYWKSHLKKHGREIETLWCRKFDDEIKLVRFALLFSKLNHIVESKDWANKMIENGLDGGAGHPHTQETKIKMSKTRKGRTKSLEWRAKIGASNKGKTRKWSRPRTEEDNLRVSGPKSNTENMKGRFIPKVSCLVCRKVIAAPSIIKSGIHLRKCNG